MATNMKELQYLVNHAAITQEHIKETNRLLRKLSTLGYLDLMDDLSLRGMLQLYRPPMAKPLDKFEIIANFKGNISETHKAALYRLKKNFETNGKLTDVEEMTLNCIMEIWDIY